MPNIQNPNPVDFRSAEYKPMFTQLQGNIVKGHGRDHTVNLFLQFTGDPAKPADRDKLRDLLRWLALTYVTSAYQQLIEREQYTRLGVPGSLFGNLFLTRSAYVKLGFEAQLSAWFPDPRDHEAPDHAPFLARMAGLAGELHDQLPAVAREPLEEAYAAGTIDALLLLADDSRDHLLRTARSLITRLEQEEVARVVAVEHGTVLRNTEGQGIEHFGYVDGRSQPLFLASDFRDLDQYGRINFLTRERVDDGVSGGASGRMDAWNPVARLSLALVKDPGVESADAYGSYYVFRKLEQNVRGFAEAERALAAALRLSDPARAGAMMVGRFRDGTPLVLSPDDRALPAQSNNFRYDGLDANHQPDPNAPLDPLGLKCPFQAHIRKVNPRQNVNVVDAETSPADLAVQDRLRRIVRRGITYGERQGTTATDANLADLPPGGVGMLFACFQSSIRNQFAFMQTQWANRFGFRVGGGDLDSTGLDPIIGHRLDGSLPHHWRREYGGTFHHDQFVSFLPLSKSHPTELGFQGFVRFRGGEFFFAPSLPFFLR